MIVVESWRRESLFRITDSTFSDNMVEKLCGVIYAVNGSFTFRSSSFANNSTTFGSVMVTADSSFNITSSIFTKNSAGNDSGVVNLYSVS